MADVIHRARVGRVRVFALVWLLQADVRGWLEQPKHRFQDETRQYDRTLRKTVDGQVIA